MHFQVFAQAKNFSQDEIGEDITVTKSFGLHWPYKSVFTLCVAYNPYEKMALLLNVHAFNKWKDITHLIRLDTYNITAHVEATDIWNTVHRLNPERDRMWKVFEALSLPDDIMHSIRKLPTCAKQEADEVCKACWASGFYEELKKRNGRKFGLSYCGRRDNPIAPEGAWAFRFTPSGAVGEIVF